MQVSTVNNSLLSAFSDVELKLNGTTVNPSTKWYGYKVQIQNVLSYNDRVRMNKLYTSGYFGDTAGEFNNLTPTDGTNRYLNKALVGRTAYFASVTEGNPPLIDWKETQGRAFLQGQLINDLATLPFGIPMGVAIDVKLTFAEKGFYLLKSSKVTSRPTFEIESLELHVMTREMAIDRFMQYQELIKKNPAVQHFIQTRMMDKALDIGRSITNIENVFNGNPIPARAFFVIVPSESINGGKMDSNPYWFSRQWGTVKLLTIECTVDGIHVDSYKSGVDDLRAQNQMAYNRFLKNTGQFKTSIFSPNVHYVEFVGKGQLKLFTHLLQLTLIPFFFRRLRIPLL